MILKEKEEEKIVIKHIKLKDRLDPRTQNIFINTKNPIDDLGFQKIESKQVNNFWIPMLMVLLLTTSMLLNSYFMERWDPVIVKTLEKAYLGSQSLFYNQLNKPYVVTVGEFDDFQMAKSEAIKLLPKLKQIDIKELPGGTYTFEIDKFGSKEKAYSLAKKFAKKGFESVHVRYLRV